MTIQFTISPPIAPSTVFFGEILGQSFFLPKNVPIKYVNVGNLHFSEGKKQISPTVSVDEEDIAAFKKMAELGVELDLRGVPSDKGRNLIELL